MMSVVCSKLDVRHWTFLFHRDGTKQYPISNAQRRISKCLFLVLSLTTASTVLFAQAPNSVSTRYLRLDADTQRGTFVLNVIVDPNGQPYSSLPITGILVDGIVQRGFTVADQHPLVLRNDNVEIMVIVLDSRAIVLEARHKDAGRHDFELAIRSTDGTAYYGGGERFNALNQRGFALPMVSDDRYGNKGVGTHKPIPFVMSTDGYGIWLDGYEPAVFDLDATKRFGTTIRSPADVFRVVFAGGPAFADILQTFTKYTGRTVVPPPWAFGLWKSRDVHHNRDSVIADVNNLRRFGIPASVLVLDSPWETGYNDFEVNRKQFQDPEGMFRQIQAAGFQLCLWLTPFVNSRNVRDMQGITERSNNFDEAQQYLVKDTAGNVSEMDWWKGRGGLIDFTDQAANAWWHRQLLKTKAYGAKAFKADDGEGNFVPDAVFSDGSTAGEMKNRYGTLYNRAMQEYIDEHLNGNGVLITRSGSLGTQRYPFSWAGDNRADFSFSDGLPSVILAGQNAALSGISLWGSDIAGYAGTPSKELFIRWTQHSVFTPFMQVHMTSNLGPWDFGDEALGIFRKFAVLRNQLFPYLYHYVHESAATGMPVIRPMVLAFQTDQQAHRQVYQYMFGNDFLVAPVYQPGTSRSVYVPAGGWYNYWTRTPFSGPATVEVQAPLDQIPLFVREGALIPMIPPDVETLVERNPEIESGVSCLDDRRILQVWPGESARLDTWDGLSATIGMKNGQRLLTISTTLPRAVEVHLVHQTVSGLSAAGGTVRKDKTNGATIISFARITKPIVLQWRER